MSQIHHKDLKGFSAKKISLDEAIRLLGRNGIRVNREEAEAILDFLYLIARTYKTRKGHFSYEKLEP